MVKFALPLSFVLLASGAYAATILEALKSTPELSTLNTVVTTAASEQLRTTLGSLKDVTILAPNNQAFLNLLSELGPLTDIPQATVDTLLTYHVLNGTLRASDLNTEGGAVGETLLTDPTYANLGEGESQVVLASAYGMSGIEAKKDALKVYSGAGESSSVAKADVEFDGGVVHIIDKVLTLPMSISDTAKAAKLTALVGALEATNLTNTVDTTPKLTVFAPTDEAFGKVDTSKLTPTQIADVLKYHVVAGTVGYSSVLEDGMVIETLAGKSLKITIKDDKIFVNDIAVITANVITANGVVHVIDGVLMADSPAAPNATQTGSGPNPTQSENPDSSAGKLGATLAAAIGMAFFAISLF